MKTVPLRGHRRLASEQVLLPPDPARRGSRSLILNAALLLFAERGFGGTSVRDIAAEAGVQPGTMYAHFPAKEDVLAEIIRIGYEEHYRRSQKALMSSQPKPEQQIAALVRAHVIAHATYPMLGVVANTELHALSAQAAAKVLEVRRLSEHAFQEVIARGIESGVFHTPDAWLALAAIGAMGMRVAHWYTPQFKLDLEKVAEIYVEFAWRILGVNEARAR
jgi:AcrR family transcriptional regulator